MDTGTYAVIASMVAGSLRTLLLWRASSGVEVINVAVLSALAEGRGRDLERLLRGAGSALYLEVARAIARAALDWQAAPGEQDLRPHLQRTARSALAVAGHRIRRHAWLDYLALAGLVYAGMNAAVYGRATPFKAVALLAATLLWIANLRTVRSVATRCYVGAGALVDSLVEGFDRLPDFGAPKPEASRS